MTGHPRSNEGLEAIRSAQSTSIHFSPPIHPNPPPENRKTPGLAPRPGHWLFGTPTTSPGTNLRRTDTPQNKTLSRGAGRRTSSTRSPTGRVATRPRTSSTRSPTSLERSWSTPKRQDTGCPSPSSDPPLGLRSGFEPSGLGRLPHQQGLCGEAGLPRRVTPIGGPGTRGLERADKHCMQSPQLQGCLLPEPEAKGPTQIGNTAAFQITGNARVWGAEPVQS